MVPASTSSGPGVIPRKRNGTQNDRPGCGEPQEMERHEDRIRRRNALERDQLKQQCAARRGEAN